VASNEAWRLGDDFVEACGAVHDVVIEGLDVPKNVVDHRCEMDACLGVVGVAECLLEEAEEAPGSW